ncbi:hypothetical protein CBR_g18927 [Chara braunii]|uniref:Uncharacterized protein n=1 Tax=Chara braunii TaxID=69332 RepID=A0A388KWV3_CHABU|nr:hypothetical protein CBR_g18927 [Chara braunii]|eukprot:GBG74517.1 hypothetical protein CBR_g18927 [Chara braunii]
MENRNRSRMRIVESPSGELHEEMRKMRDMERCTLREVEVLKQRKADEERKRLEAEKKKLDAEAEVTKLRERIEKLMMETSGIPTGGTNLKGQLEAAADVGGSASKTVRRGRHRLTPRRTEGEEGSAVDVNNRFTFVQIERKRLRALKKYGLETLCKQEGIAYKTVETTVDEIAEIRADARFGRKDKGTAKKAAERNGKETGSEPSSSQGEKETSTEVEDVPSDSA